MREILFRGKREDNGEWIDGSLLFDPDLGSAQIIGFEYWTSETGIERGEFSEFVNRKTVGQYTGLEDKNGYRIFEGDIVAYVDTGHIMTVEYHRNRFVFVNRLRHFFEMIYPEDFEVIGNIHDNPELMEGS